MYGLCQIYDKGVENGDLSASHGSKWADTLANREEEVAKTAFWGQIATYLTSTFFASFESGQAKGVISSWNKGGTVQRTCGAREGRFFVDQGRDGSEDQRNVRRTCSESILRVSSPQAFPLFHFPHSFQLTPRIPCFLRRETMSTTTHTVSLHNIVCGKKTLQEQQFFFSKKNCISFFVKKDCISFF